MWGGGRTEHGFFLSSLKNPASLLEERRVGSMFSSSSPRIGFSFLPSIHPELGSEERVVALPPFQFHSGESGTALGPPKQA